MKRTDEELSSQFAFSTMLDLSALEMIVAHAPEGPPRIA